jgi:hypothetical protein
MSFRIFLYYAFALGVMCFSIVMVTKVIPYLSFERAINFLGTKPDEVLDKSHFMWAFYIHIISSLIVMPFGVLQFSSFLFRRYRNIHLLAGKSYILAILLFAAPSGLLIAQFANGGLAAKVGFTLQSLIWWFYTYQAWQLATQKQWQAHCRAMMKSLAITLAAMSLRVESYVMYYVFGTKPIETYLTVTWLSWVGNLFIAELLLFLRLDMILIKSFFIADAETDH